MRSRRIFQVAADGSAPAGCPPVDARRFADDVTPSIKICAMESANLREVSMSTRSCVVLTAALLCSGLPAWGQQLPDGPGKELAEANCNICHTLLSRVGSGYTPQGWTTVLQMMHNQGAPLPADQVEPLKAYLIKSFPEKGKPAGVVIPGPGNISFKAWQAP